MRKVLRLQLVLILVLLVFNFSGCNNVQEASNPDSQSIKDMETASEAQKQTQVTYDDSLCSENEDLVFSFRTEDGNKILSICISQAPDYIVYRFGTRDKVELEYPLDKTDSWNSFTYDYYLRGGGAGNAGQDLNYLSFEKDNFIYRVCDEYDAEQNSYVVGVKVIDKSTNKETDIKGKSKERIGTLVTLRDSKIKHGSDDFTGF